MDADLLWSAAVDDKTGTFFRDFDQNVDNLTRRTKQSFDEVEAGSTKSAQSIGLIAGAVSALTNQLLSMGLSAIRQFTALAKSAVGVAARAETLAVALRTVGGNAGYSADELAGFEESMKNNGITTIKTREALLKMAQANLDLSKSSQLARVAQDAAVIAGTNSSDAFGRMIHGITTLNPLILRNLGIVVNAQYEYKKYADEMGVTAQQMDYNTKQQLMLNAVLQAGERIQGTYTAAMGTAGKQAGSLARHQEEVLLALGRIAQPMYLEWIQFMTRELKNLRDWFDENEEGLTDLSQTLGFLVGKVLDLASSLRELFKIEEPGGAIRKLPIFMIFEILPDIDKRWENLGTTAKQFFSIVAAGWAGIFTLINEYGGAISKVVKALTAAIEAIWKMNTMDFAGAQEAATRAMLHFNDAVGQSTGAWEKASGVAKDTFMEWTTGLGLVEDSAKATEDALEDLGSTMKEIAAETESVIDAIKELNEKVGKDFAELAKRQARQDIDNAIREARQREDIARRHHERIQDIYKDAAKERTDTIEELADDERELADDQARERMEAERDHARDLLDIETDYRRRLEDIQRRFDEDASEAARRNDAVTMARLIRQNKRNLEEAKIGRDRNIDDAQRDYSREIADLVDAQAVKRDELRKAAAERMEDLQKDLEERLREAKESRQEDLDNLARSLAREREDLVRHREWDIQDLREKHAEELKALGDHFSNLQYIDELGLRYLLEQHGEYIAQDLIMWNQYYAQRERLEAKSRYPTVVSQQDRDYLESFMTGGTGWSSAWGGSGSSSWGMAKGGMGIAMNRQTITVGEDEPEVVTAIPLSRMMTHNVRFSDWNVNVNGVSPQAESELVPAMMNMMNHLAVALRSSLVGGRNVAIRT